MKIKILSLFILVSFAFRSESSIKKDSSYVRIQYLGPSNKFFPVLTFYYDSIDSSAFRFDNSYKITKGQFNAIETFIEKNKYLDKISVHSRAYFTFTIFANEELTRYAADDNETSRPVFDEILHILQNSPVKENVEEKMNEIEERLGFAKNQTVLTSGN